jgi:predicted dienelactone hydrolase
LKACTAADGSRRPAPSAPNPWNALVDGLLSAASAVKANEVVFAAWTHADPDAAKRNATPAAVEELFAGTWQLLLSVTALLGIVTARCAEVVVASGLDR